MMWWRLKFEKVGDIPLCLHQSKKKSVFKLCKLLLVFYVHAFIFSSLIIKRLYIKYIRLGFAERAIKLSSLIAIKKAKQILQINNYPSKLSNNNFKQKILKHYNYNN